MNKNIVVLTHNPKGNYGDVRPKIESNKVYKGWKKSIKSLELKQLVLIYISKTSFRIQYLMKVIKVDDNTIDLELLHKFTEEEANKLSYEKLQANGLKRSTINYILDNNPQLYKYVTNNIHHILKKYDNEELYQKSSHRTNQVKLKDVILKSLKDLKKPVTYKEVLEHIQNKKYFKFGGETPINTVSSTLGTLVKDKRYNIEEDRTVSPTLYYLSKSDVFKFSKEIIVHTFPHKNLLFKGVPGTGKSRMIDKIIQDELHLDKQSDNILRINIHSASSNADLMQGIGIDSNDGTIEYKEKQGLLLEHIQKATFAPLQPFVLILEEIQENSLNELIGDLIYLIEPSKRVKELEPDDESYTYDGLIDKLINENIEMHKVQIPNLIAQKTENRYMVIPDNLYIFCTSNYRDDKKVIEDNLLRRFDVIELYSRYKEEIGDDFKSQEVSDFLEALNESIVKVFEDNGEIHPDRFMIGHANWMEVTNQKEFYQALLKVLTEFKDIKDIHFDDFQKVIQDENIVFPFEIEINHEELNSYEKWIRYLQKECYDFLNKAW